ncbi:raffinose/stachyose/melibiose transport system substrate-binding protein [Paenibacillus algorifonticola]|uniref:Raffinose/stachyose/melibiose transport system substrate-binding protein n=1 Tax=Paenibacillus algorifonticola TaxID=684063 RepID=A0A1I2HBN5_9BACL|nr:extracellular solute-binding protein [Paenibacillus algorifonticola]SFF26001.1 raffinose/stachyose/melibiose transport system substrate-binding protein [Paenibacillus algorifonticola]
MNLSKRFITSLLTIGLGASLVLSGCGSTGGNSEAPGTNGSSGNTAKDGGSLTLWMFNTDDYLKPVAEEIAEEMNIKLNYEFINPETYKTKIKVAISANELPDVFAQYAGKSERESVLNAKMAAPLNDTLQSTGLENSFNDGMLIKEEDGNIYSLPYRPDQSYLLAYNKKLMSELGVKAPTTWEELMNIIKAANDKGIAPIALGGKDRWPGEIIYNMLVLREDKDAYTKAQNGEMSFADKPFVDAADKLIELVKANAFQSGFLGNSDLEARELFYGGKALMIINGSWIFSKAIPALGDDLGYVKFPKTGAEADPFSSNMGEKSTAPYGLYVNAKSKQLELSKEFAVRYSLKVNESLAKLGQATYAQTEVKPEGVVNEAYAQYLKDYSEYSYIQTFWGNTIPAAVNEENRDLNQKLYTGSLPSSEFVQMMDKIMKQQ